jgi:hypothetical protein
MRDIAVQKVELSQFPFVFPVKAEQTGARLQG